MTYVLLDERGIDFVPICDEILCQQLNKQTNCGDENRQTGTLETLLVTYEFKSVDL